MLHYLTIPVTAFQQNCSLLWCDQTHEAALIDPGGDIDTLLAQLQAQQLTLTALWLTHATSTMPVGRRPWPNKPMCPSSAPTGATSSGLTACPNKA